MQMDEWMDKQTGRQIDRQILYVDKQAVLVDTQTDPWTERERERQTEPMRKLDYRMNCETDRRMDGKGKDRKEWE